MLQVREEFARVVREETIDTYLRNVSETDATPFTYPKVVHSPDAPDNFPVTAGSSIGGFFRARELSWAYEGVLSPPPELFVKWGSALEDWPLVDVETLDIERQLQEMEERTGVSSEEFYQNWMQGTVSDTFENNAWALLVEARETLLGRDK